MVRMNEQQAEAFVTYARSVLARHNNPPQEDAARILAFAEGLVADYVSIRRSTTQSIATALAEGFLEGRTFADPPATPDDDD